jgi:SWI/SNF-related matrix-associated actin-dependent regulator 1 of chromatin subfamily A
VIVFCWHTEILDSIRESFPDLLEVSGRVGDLQVSNNIKRFQEDEKARIIGLTYKRGGVGHTLTAASHVIFMELGWNPMHQDQAEDRAHRISQKNNVICHYLLGKSTLDEWRYRIIEEKRKHSAETVGSTEQIETSVANDLIKMIMNNKTPQKEDAHAH